MNPLFVLAPIAQTYRPANGARCSHCSSHTVNPQLENGWRFALRNRSSAGGYCRQIVIWKGTYSAARARRKPPSDPVCLAPRSALQKTGRAQERPARAPGCARSFGERTVSLLKHPLVVMERSCLSNRDLWEVGMCRIQQNVPFALERCRRNDQRY